MNLITVPELKEILLNRKGATPIAFSAITDTKAKKTGNPYAAVLKFSAVQAMTGINYENNVNNQLAREGKEADFVAQERTWGENVNGSLVVKGDKSYLVARVLRAKKPVFIVKGRDGKLSTIAKAAIAHLLPAERKAENQGTDKEVVYRNYSLENIRSISIDGKKYQLVPATTL